MSVAAFFRAFRKRPRNVVPKVYAPQFSVAALSVVQNSTVQTTVTFPRSDFSGAITPTVSGLPSGVTGAFSPSTLNGSEPSTTLTLTASAGATIVSNDTFAVSCTTSGSPDLTGASANGTVTVVASATPTVAIAASKSSTTALQGDSDNFDVTLTRTNYTGDVTIAVSGLPSGATASISPNPLTGGTLVAGVVVTNDVAASTASNDAYTVGATGSGVTDATPINMTHTITSPNVTRGIPNTSTAVKGTDFQYADDAALQAACVDSEGNTQKLSMFCAVTKRSALSLQTSSITGQKVMRYIADPTGGPPQMQMYFAGYPGQPTANRAGGVNTAFTEFGAYAEVSYATGFTTAGSGATSNAYKLTAVGMANYSGRCGIEWTNTSGYSYTMGLSGWGPSAPATNGNGTARPYTVTNSVGVWLVPQIVCHYWQVTIIDSDQFKSEHWTWLKGTDPTALPQATLTYSKATSGLAAFPTYNRIAPGENFNQTAANRYAPVGNYIDWHALYVWDLGYDSNPLNL